MAEFPMQTELTNVTRIQPAKIITQFGLQRLRTTIYGNRADGSTAFDNAELDNDGNRVVSYLGTPVFSNLEVPEGKYINLQGEEISYEALRVDTVLFDVSQSRNIVTTEIQGRNGTIKEYISDGDFSVNINGLIVSQDANVYPEDEVTRLVEILKVQDTVPIASRFLNDVFNITNVVVVGYSFPQPEGTPNTQPFSIQCLSNDPIELEIKPRT
jgi:hypothetical protein